jgi:hypothetical protein
MLDLVNVQRRKFYVKFSFPLIPISITERTWRISRIYHVTAPGSAVQRGPKVTSLVARSSCVRCTQLCVGFADVTRIRRESGACHANASLVPVVSHLRISLMGLESVARSRSETTGTRLTQMLRAKFAYDVRHVARVYIYIIQMLRAPVAGGACNEGMLLLDPLCILNGIFTILVLGQWTYRRILHQDK